MYGGYFQRYLHCMFCVSCVCHACAARSDACAMADEIHGFQAVDCHDVLSSHVFVLSFCVMCDVCGTFRNLRFPYLSGYRLGCEGWGCGFVGLWEGVEGWGGG